MNKDAAIRRPWSVAPVLTATATSVFLLFVLLPVGTLVSRGGWAGIQRLATDGELRGALWLTAWCATLATALGVLIGTPAGWVLARREFRGKALLAAAIDLPLVLPHPVAGIALVLLLGKDSPLGQALGAVGLRVVSSPLGIMLAMAFVSVSLFVSAARETFARIDRRYESVAQTLGDTPARAFRRVTLPLASRGLVAGATVMWARAVSEFGAVVILAHTPQTISVLSYDRFTTYGLTEALPVAAALVLLALLPLALLRALRRDAWWQSTAQGADT